jgi:hypothetical protein
MSRYCNAFSQSARIAMFPVECGVGAWVFCVLDLPVWTLQRRFFVF